MHAPVLSDHRGCIDGSLWPFEHHGWNLDLQRYFILVCDAVIELFLGWLVKVHLYTGKVSHFTTFYISNIHVVISQQFLDQVKNEGDGAPSVQICTLERDELGCGVQKLALTVDQLMERVHIHELVVVSRACLDVLVLVWILQS